MFLCALLTKIYFSDVIAIDHHLMNYSFKLTLSCLALLAFVLVGWAVLRSNNWLDNYTGYTDGTVLVWARSLIVISVIAAFVDLQPFAIALFTRETSVWTRITDVFGPLLLIFGIIVSLLSSSLGRFLLTSQHQKSWRTRSLRIRKRSS